MLEYLTEVPQCIFQTTKSVFYGMIAFLLPQLHQGLSNINRIYCKVLRSFRIGYLSRVTPSPTHVLQLSLAWNLRDFPSLSTHLLQNKRYPSRLSTNATSSMKPSLISPSGNDCTFL